MTDSTSPDPTPSVSRASSDPEYAANLRRATLASSVGSALEYYDFALYGLASALIFGPLFFPALDGGAGTASSLATFAVGFLARPFGGLLFGALGDRLGRKAILIITIGLMGGASTLIGVLPTGEQVGVLGPILLIVLRILQGLGAGAEQAGATVLMAEYAPVRRRGYFAALPFVGIMIGTILANTVFFLLGLAPTEVVQGGLWRIPFLASIVLIAIALFIRFRLAESPTFIKLEKQDQAARNPFKEVFSSSFPSVLRGIGLRMAENGGSAIYQTLAISFIATATNAAPWEGPLAIIFGAALGIFVIPYSGRLSDRFGRMRIYRIGSIIQLVLAIPAWALLATGQPALVVPILAITYGVGVNVMLGAQCATLPELFGNTHRYVGVAVSREFSAVIAGGIAPLVGVLLLEAAGYAWWPAAVYSMVLSAITLFTTFHTPETRGRDLTLVTDAIKDTEHDVRTRPTAMVSRAEHEKDLASRTTR